MKVLFLVAELESANGICVQSVVKHLAERNTEVHVLTCHDQTTEKYKNENSSITVVSIPTKGFARITEWLKGIEGKLKGPANALSSNLHRIWVLACYPCWPMTSVLRVWQFAARAIQIVKDKDIDIVIPIFNSIEMLTAGYWVKKKNRKVKLVPYFLDALSAGQKPRFMREETRLKKALWWEKKLLSDAEGVVMMASAKKSYEKMQQKLDYQDRITFLDIPMLTPQEIPTSRIQRRHFPKEEVIFFFAGAMARNIRDPKYFIELFSSITEPSWNLYLAGSSDYGFNEERFQDSLFGSTSSYTDQRNDGRSRLFSQPRELAVLHGTQQNFRVYGI